MIIGLIIMECLLGVWRIPSPTTRTTLFAVKRTPLHPEDKSPLSPNSSECCCHLAVRVRPNKSLNALSKIHSQLFTRVPIQLVVSRGTNGRDSITKLTVIKAEPYITENGAENRMTKRQQLVLVHFTINEKKPNFKWPTRQIAIANSEIKNTAKHNSAFQFFDQFQ